MSTNSEERNSETEEKRKEDSGGDNRENEETQETQETQETKKTEKKSKRKLKQKVFKILKRTRNEVPTAIEASVLACSIMNAVGARVRSSLMTSFSSNLEAGLYNSGGLFGGIALGAVCFLGIRFASKGASKAHKIIKRKKIDKNDLSFDAMKQSTAFALTTVASLISILANVNTLSFVVVSAIAVNAFSFIMKKFIDSKDKKNNMENEKEK